MTERDTNRLIAWSNELRTLFPAIEAAHPDLAPVLRKLEQDHSMIDYLLASGEKSLQTGDLQSFSTTR